jgi:hypothetical protein
MNCTLFANNCSPNPAALWLVSSHGSKPNKKHQVVPYSKHDEQSDAPERRSQANWQGKINHRRPVIVNVRRLTSSSPAAP